MDAGRLIKVASDVVCHLDAITDPGATDDAAKRAILEIAAKTYEAKVGRETTIALVRNLFQNL